jgi:hypothetical protein
MWSSLSTWEEAARQDSRTPQHQRTGLAVSTPTQRAAELTALLNLTRGYLADACRELRNAQTRLERFHTFHGVSFAHVTVGQHWADFVLWETVLNENPGLRGIVEFGTGAGGFSIWLNAQCQARGMFFRTYDTAKPGRVVPGFVQQDILKQHRDIGHHIARHEPLLLFCDNGDKPLELKLYTPHIQHPASLVMVHDWNQELSERDVPLELEMVYEPFCQELGSITRVFRKRQEDE